MVQHLPPFLVGQPVFGWPGELVVGEDAALGYLQVGRPVLLDHRHHDVDLVDTAHRLLKHNRVGDAIALGVGVGGHVGDDRRLGLLLHVSVATRLAFGCVGGGHGQVLQLAAVEADDGILFLRQRLAPQLFFGHGLEGAGQFLQPLQAVVVLLHQQAPVAQSLPGHGRQRRQPGIEAGHRLDVAFGRHRLGRHGAGAQFGVDLLGVKDGVVLQLGPTAQHRVELLVHPGWRLHKGRVALARHLY